MKLKSLFRDRALEAMEVPDQLDRVFQATNARGWLALVGVVAVLLVALGWGVTGTLQVQVPASGVLERPGELFTVAIRESGFIEAVLVKEGQLVGDGEYLATMVIDTGPDEPWPVSSPQSGRVIELMVTEGEYAEHGRSLARIERDDSDNDLVAMLFLPAREAGRVEPGMAVEVLPQTVHPREHGYLRGEVVDVEDFPVTLAGLERRLGNEALARTFIGETPPVLVRVALRRTQSNTSGYEWSISGGPDHRLRSGTLCDARITLRRTAPIQLLFDR